MALQSSQIGCLGCFTVATEVMCVHPCSGITILNDIKCVRVDLLDEGIFETIV
jgi:hypothetical protein